MVSSFLVEKKKENCGSKLKQFSVLVKDREITLEGKGDQLMYVFTKLHCLRSKNFNKIVDH